MGCTSGKGHQNCSSYTKQRSLPRKKTFSKWLYTKNIANDTPLKRIEVSGINTTNYLTSSVNEISVCIYIGNGLVLFMLCALILLILCSNCNIFNEKSLCALILLILCSNCNIFNEKSYVNHYSLTIPWDHDPKYQYRQFSMIRNNALLPVTRSKDHRRFFAFQSLTRPGPHSSILLAF